MANALDHGIYNDGTLNTAAKLNDFFDYCVLHKEEAYFPNGIYLFEDFYSYDFGNVPMIIRGESREGTIITTYFNGSGVTMRVPLKIDATAAPPSADGIYQVDTIGPTNNSAYGSLTLSVGDYIQKSGSTWTEVTLSTVKSANYVTYLDIDNPPSIDGYYIVDKGVDTFGGGYAHTSWNSLIVIIGSIVKRTTDIMGVTWEVFEPGTGFSCYDDIIIKDITFRDYNSFIFNPYGDFESNCRLQITNCAFKMVLRVCAFEITGSSSWQAAGVLHPMLPYNSSTVLFTVPTTSYRFNFFEISDCLFEYIHQSIFWGTPASNNFIIKNNVCQNNFSTLAYFVIIGGDTATGNACLRNYNYFIEGNTFKTCRIEDLSGVSTIFFQFYDNSKFVNNTFLDTFGIHCYNSGYDSVVEGNIAVPYVTYNMPAGEVIFLYKNEPNYIYGKQVLANNVVDGCGVGIVHSQQSTKIIASGNTLRMSRSANYVVSTTTYVSERLFYYVIDVTNFTTIVTSAKVGETITSGDRVYFDTRRGKWYKIGTGFVSALVPVFESDPSGTETDVKGNPGYEILSNEIHSDMVYKCDRFVEMCVISGNTITGVNNLVYATSSPAHVLKNIIIKNNPLIELILTGSDDLKVINNIYIEGNTFYVTDQSFLKAISTTGSIYINNNTFSLKPGLIIGSSISNKPLISAKALLNINIDGNVINPVKLYENVINVLNAKAIKVTNNIIDVNSASTANTRRILFVDYTEDDSKYISLNNNSIAFNDSSSTRIILAIDSGADYAGNDLILNNNISDGANQPTKIIDPTNIDFTKIISIGNSWDEVTQLITSNFTSIVASPEALNQTIIIYDTMDIPNADISFPSSAAYYLKDGMEITIAVTGNKVSDLGISNATILPAPPSPSWELTTGESVILKYVKSTDTWYRVNSNF